MWIFTRDGFFSAVEHRENDGLVMLRARFRGDLERLVDRIAHDDPPAIQETPRADYRYRTVIEKGAWAEYLAHAALEIDYPNFKHEVLADAESERDSAYHRIWSVLLAAQETQVAGAQDEQWWLFDDQ